MASLVSLHPWPLAPFSRCDSRQRLRSAPAVSWGGGTGGPGGHGCVRMWVRRDNRRLLRGVMCMERYPISVSHLRRSLDGHCQTQVSRMNLSGNVSSRDLRLGAKLGRWERGARAKQSQSSFSGCLLRLRSACGEGRLLCCKQRARSSSWCLPCTALAGHP